MYIFKYNLHDRDHSDHEVDCSWEFHQQRTHGVRTSQVLLTSLAPQELVHRLSKLQEAREKLLEAENVADTEIAKLDKIIDDMENQLPGWCYAVLVVSRGPISMLRHVKTQYLMYTSLQAIERERERERARERERERARERERVRVCVYCMCSW